MARWKPRQALFLEEPRDSELETSTPRIVDSMRRRTTTSFKGLPPLRRSVEELGFTVIFHENQGARFSRSQQFHTSTHSAAESQHQVRSSHVDDLQQTREAGLQLQHRDTQQQAQGKHGKKGHPEACSR